MKGLFVSRRVIASVLWWLLLAFVAMPALASTDPVAPGDRGDQRHFNRYAYSYNAPFRYVDPDGRLGLDWSQRYRATVDLANGDVDVATARMAEGFSIGLEAASVATGVPGAIRAGTVRALPRLVVMADGAADAARANKIHHIFGKPAHNLAGMSERMGGNANAMKALEQATTKAVQGHKDGAFETVARVGGENVTVRGSVVDGQARIGTAFVRKEVPVRAAD